VNNILVTLEINLTRDKDPYDDVCRKARLNYVNRIGCDYISITDNKIDPILWNKFQIYDIVNGKYDKALYIDADVLITPNCPNVFDVIDTGIGVVMDGWNRNCGLYEAKKRNEMDINSGFILACKDSFDIFKDYSNRDNIKRVDWDGQGGMSDQTYFRSKIKNSNITYTQLSELWNYLLWYNDYVVDRDDIREVRKKSGVTRKDAYMIHYTTLKILMKIDYEYFYGKSDYLPIFEQIEKERFSEWK